MPKLRYAIVDVFTAVRWTGNPLSVVLDSGGLSPGQMQAIAREMNLSETTFITRRAASVEAQHGVAVRIFTPKEEVPFAGHPTLGTAWMLWNSDHTATVTLDVKGGRIPVTFEETKAGVFGEMLQPEPTFGQTHTATVIAELAGVQSEDLVDDIPVQTVSTGRPKIMVPLRSLAAIRRLKPDFARIESYCRSTDGATGFYYVTRETEDSHARMHARNILSWTEDPVTGSAGGACIAWMVKHGWARSGERIMIEQGAEVHRAGAMFGSALLRGAAVTEVRLAGQCVLAAQGELMLGAP